MGRLTAPKTAAISASSSGDIVTDASSGGASTGFTITDPAGDAVPHPSGGKVYGPSDIVSMSVRSDGTNLVITTVYTPSTPMNLISVGTRIRLDLDMLPSCKDSVLDSFDWSIDCAIDGIEVSQAGASCDDRLQPTKIAGAVDIVDSTLTMRIAQSSLGIDSGQRIVVRGCVSTRIDSGHTTFIQDRASDSPAGTTGAV